LINEYVYCMDGYAEVRARLEAASIASNRACAARARARGAIQGPVLLQRFLEINQAMFLDVAQTRPDTIAIDHYPDFLGHTDNANIRGCPHCGADNTPWTVIAHPNPAGSAHIADEWALVFERVLGSSCGLH
jgi:hypothetical protein